MPGVSRTIGRLTAVSLAVAILYGLAVSPLFVYCVGASGHREVEPTTCSGCVHHSDAAPADPADPPRFSQESHHPDNCGDCTDFSLTLAATERGHSDGSPGAPSSPPACPCPPEGLPVSEWHAAAAASAGLPDPAFPVPALLRPLRI